MWCSKGGCAPCDFFLQALTTCLGYYSFCKEIGQISYRNDFGFVVQVGGIVVP